jgi:hypothetical protein
MKSTPYPSRNIATMLRITIPKVNFSLLTAVTPLLARLIHQFLSASPILDYGAVSLEKLFADLQG